MLRNLFLNKWQQDSDSGETGRAIFNMLSKVTLTPASWSRESILFATGHGPFPSYLCRFQPHHSDTCACWEKELTTTQLLVTRRYLIMCRKYSTLVEKRTFK
ncbi:hypothetical protein AVEN_257588-1 [Araneus ventricosus]|uniref:Uncharacterized protein n=1 Tax=Araneus ventricosus TaxID=182803 RepID=A0A4Y2T534_ARAVE|nr:hypothetical protein AVEN_257588-1 [Araneus ventricosus]